MQIKDEAGNFRSDNFEQMHAGLKEASAAKLEKEEREAEQAVRASRHALLFPGICLVLCRVQRCTGVSFAIERERASKSVQAWRSLCRYCDLCHAQQPLPNPQAVEPVCRGCRGGAVGAAGVGGVAGRWTSPPSESRLSSQLI